jgi:APA family basic amino acid/polyamine antiporter
MCTALVVGNMVGSGIFLLPASLGAYGGVSIVGWLVTSAGAMFLALTFARLARALPRVGGPYAYARASFGDFPAFLVAWGYWISICAGNAAIAVALVGSLAYFWPVLAARPAMGGAAALASIWLLALVNLRGVRTAGWVQLVTTVVKLAPLVAIGTVGLLFLHWDNFTPFNVSGRSMLSAVSSTAALTLWAFTGLESATIPADDVEKPDRVIPRATLLGTALAAMVYILATAAVMGVMPPAALAASPAPFADAASRMWGPGAAAAVAAGAAVACFGVLNGWTLLLGQLPLAAAMDGLLPRVFARLSARGTPAFALVSSTALVTLVVATNYAKGLVTAFTFIILLSTLATLLAYACSSMALVVSNVRARDGLRGWRLAGWLGVALLAFGYSMWAVVGVGRDTVFWGLLLLLAGVPAYLWVTRHAVLARQGRRDPTSPLAFDPIDATARRQEAQR